MESLCDTTVFNLSTISYWISGGRRKTMDDVYRRLMTVKKDLLDFPRGGDKTSVIRVSRQGIKSNDGNITILMGHL